jgi:replicative DNA helicase
VVIDYLQLLRVQGKYERDDLRQFEINKKAKFAAEKTGAPFLMLTQCSRRPEQEKRIPNMSDAKNGGIEEVADRFYSLWRPAVYGIEEDESGNSIKYLSQLRICKDRQFGENVGKTYDFKFHKGRLIAAAAYDDLVFEEERPAASSWGGSMPVANTSEELPF